MSNESTTERNAGSIASHCSTSPFVVDYTECANSEIKWRDALGYDWQFDPGWKVGIVVEDTERFIPLNFARCCDAEAAAMALKRLANWGQTLEEVTAQLKQIGAHKLRSTMIEALQW